MIEHSSQCNEPYFLYIRFKYRVTHFKLSAPKIYIQNGTKSVTVYPFNIQNCNSNDQTFLLLKMNKHLISLNDLNVF